MNPRNELTLPKWPFFLADVIFVAAAAALWFSAEPRGPGVGAMVTLLLMFAALLSLVPYLLEFYWNWQLAQADREEELEQQRQALARAGEEIAQAARRCGEMQQPAGSPPVAGPDPEIAEALRALRQGQEQASAEDAKFATQVEKLIRDQEESRQHFEQVANELAQLREERVRLIEAVGNGSREQEGRTIEKDPLQPAVLDEAPRSAVLRPEIQEEPGETLAEETLAGGGDKPAATATPARPRNSKKPQVQEAEDGALFSTTTLVATAFIGASNKLFLRGEGPGLSWDEGVPMRFVEIGKWSWTTTDATGPIQIQLFKNDEEGDRAGVLTLEPGQRLDVRPDFDG
jgi:hypothetical protein